MDNCEFLVWYGLLVIFVMGGFILIPYLRKQANLLSAWNILLLGIAVYIGLGCFDAATTPIRYKGTQWFQPSTDEVGWFLSATTLFLVSLLTLYYFDPLSRTISRRCFNKWPPITLPLVFYVLIVSVSMTLLTPFLARMPFIGKVVLNLGHTALAFACVFAFVLWYRSRTNLIWLGLFIVVFLFAALYAALAGGGRRIILSVILAPIWVMYMVHMRNWRPTKVMVAMGVAVIALTCFGMVYSSIRHFDRQGGRKERSAANLIETVKNVSERDWLSRMNPQELFDYVIRSVVQENVHYAMITDRLVRTRRLEPKPFNTFKFIVAYPIPRAFWRHKPEPLGTPVVVAATEKSIRSRSWGCSVAGQAAYEGGLIVVPLYAFLAIVGIRLIDDPLRRQPFNPFLISILVVAAPNVLGWPRGDLGHMSVQVLNSLVYAIALGISGRLIFGTAIAQPTARPAVAAVPIIRRPAAG